MAFTILHLPVAAGHADKDWAVSLGEFKNWCAHYCAPGSYYVRVILTDRLEGGVALVYEVGIEDRSLAALFKLTYA
jgi:hypothetical protein